MSWRRIAMVAFWTVCCLVFSFLALFVTQMGDCFDSTSCYQFKDRAWRVIHVGAPTIWLAGALLMTYRWSRNVQ